jgi:hypothetical protein
MFNAVAPNTTSGSSERRASGSAYLKGKQAVRDARIEAARGAHQVASDLYDQLAGHSSLARRRPPGELPAKGGPLILDAAFLVSRARTLRFRTAARRAAEALEPRGYAVSLSGPWPAYSFMKD